MRNSTQNVTRSSTSLWGKSALQKNSIVPLIQKPVISLLLHINRLVFIGELRPKLHRCFYVRFLIIVWRKSVVQFCDDFIRFYIVIKLKVLHSAYATSYPRMYKTCHPWFSFFPWFVTFMEKTPLIIKFYGVFNHFLRTCEVAKSWIIKLYHYVSNAIHANEQTK